LAKNSRVSHSFLIYYLFRAHSQGWGYLAFSSPSAPQPCSFFAPGQFRCFCFATPWL